MRKSSAQSKNPKTRDRSQVRIIGGSMRGRKIDFMDGEGLRPTLDRIRETLFNWLAPNVGGAVCLDLFAGSGALGIVDSSKNVIDSLTQNMNVLNVSNAQIINQSAEVFLAENKQQFDIIFLDPPFGKGMLEAVLPLIKHHLRQDAVVYIEQENENSVIDFGKEWKILKSKKTARFTYQLVALIR